MEYIYIYIYIYTYTCGGEKKNVDEEIILHSSPLHQPILRVIIISCPTLPHQIGKYVIR